MLAPRRDVPVLNFSEVVLRRGPRVLIDKLSWTVYAGQRIGIVGRNGTGKSSLLAMVQGELAVDAGEFSRPRDLVIAHVAQETPALACSALEYVLAGDAEWCQLDAELHLAEREAAGGRLAGLHERMHAIDGYTAKARAARLLYGLGFASADAQRAVRDFSGGWRMRLNLAQALMCRSDLLLLDEPTNHLDLDAVLWLQSWLDVYPGSLLLISHDRDFLDAVVSHVLYIENAQATVFSGNYSSCERQRAERLAQQAAAYASQQRQAEHLQKFVDRFRAKASKATQAQSRLKQLEKMQLEAPAHWDAPFRFEFLTPGKMPSPLLKLEDLAVGYHGQSLLQGLNMTLEPGDRLALLGRNGAGKSTLMRTLAGGQPPLAGKLHRDKQLSCAYFTQHQMDSLRPDLSPMAHLQALAPDAREQVLRDFLGGFDFVGDRVFEPVAPFSGGEKARLALALLVYQRPNLLLLDEPTNHLDLDMRHALEMALQDFAGAVVLISHDRHLVATCCDELRLVDEGACRPFSGDLEDYARHLKDRARTLKTEPDGAGATTGPAPRVSAKDQRRQAAERRQREKPLRDELRRLEQQTGKLEAQLADYEKQLADVDLYQSDPARAARLMKEQGATKKLLDEVEERWLLVLDELEQADA